ncbi:hypothetical protein D9M68_660730 [compost metagenome]
MLEAVGIQVARIQRGVGLHVVVEFHDLHIQAVALGNLLDDLPDLGVRTADGADADGLFLGRGATGGDKADCGDGNREALDKGRAAHRSSVVF